LCTFVSDCKYHGQRYQERTTVYGRWVLSLVWRALTSRTIKNIIIHYYYYHAIFSVCYLVSHLSAAVSCHDIWRQR